MDDRIALDEGLVVEQREGQRPRWPRVTAVLLGILSSLMLHSLVNRYGLYSESSRTYLLFRSVVDLILVVTMVGAAYGCWRYTRRGYTFLVAVLTVLTALTVQFTWTALRPVLFYLAGLVNTTSTSGSLTDHLIVAAMALVALFLFYSVLRKRNLLIFDATARGRNYAVVVGLVYAVGLAVAGSATAYYFFN